MKPSLLVRESFSCSCQLTGSVWRLRASVRVTPLIYLWNPSYLGHEKLHIEDIRTSLSTYLRGVESQKYLTREECIHNADREATEFSGLLDRFKEDSNAKRHRFYKRRHSHVVVRR